MAPVTGPGPTGPWQGGSYPPHLLPTVQRGSLTTPLPRVPGPAIPPATLASWVLGPILLMHLDPWPCPRVTDVTPMSPSETLLPSPLCRPPPPSPKSWGTDSQKGVGRGLWGQRTSSLLTALQMVPCRNHGLAHAQPPSQKVLPSRGLRASGGGAAGTVWGHLPHHRHLPQLPWDNDSLTGPQGCGHPAPWARRQGHTRALSRTSDSLL